MTISPSGPAIKIIREEFSKISLYSILSFPNVSGLTFMQKDFIGLYIKWCWDHGAWLRSKCQVNCAGRLTGHNEYTIGKLIVWLLQAQFRENLHMKISHQRKNAVSNTQVGIAFKIKGGYTGPILRRIWGIRLNNISELGGDNAKSETRIFNCNRTHLPKMSESDICLQM